MFLLFLFLYQLLAYALAPKQTTNLHVHHEHPDARVHLRNTVSTWSTPRSAFTFRSSCPRQSLVSKSHTCKHSNHAHPSTCPLHQSYQIALRSPHPTHNLDSMFPQLHDRSARLSPVLTRMKKRISLPPLPPIETPITCHSLHYPLLLVTIVHIQHLHTGSHPQHRSHHGCLLRRDLLGGKPQI